MVPPTPALQPPLDHVHLHRVPGRVCPSSPMRRRFATLGVTESKSYLTYLRDRFTVARDLLTESGSIFVQIGDENVHRVRSLLDEVFGDSNFCSHITYRTSVPLTSVCLPSVVEFAACELARSPPYAPVLQHTEWHHVPCWRECAAIQTASIPLDRRRSIQGELLARRP